MENDFWRRIKDCLVKMKLMLFIGLIFYQNNCNTVYQTNKQSKIRWNSHTSFWIVEKFCVIALGKPWMGRTGEVRLQDPTFQTTLMPLLQHRSSWNSQLLMPFFIQEVQATIAAFNYRSLCKQHDCCMTLTLADFPLANVIRIFSTNACLSCNFH